MHCTIHVPKTAIFILLNLDNVRGYLIKHNFLIISKCRSEECHNILSATYWHLKIQFLITNLPHRRKHT